MGAGGGWSDAVSTSPSEDAYVGRCCQCGGGVGQGLSAPSQGGDANLNVDAAPRGGLAKLVSTPPSGDADFGRCCQAQGGVGKFLSAR